MRTVLVLLFLALFAAAVVALWGRADAARPPAGPVHRARVPETPGTGTGILTPPIDESGPLDASSRRQQAVVGEGGSARADGADGIRLRVRVLGPDGAALAEQVLALHLDRLRPTPLDERASDAGGWVEFRLEEAWLEWRVEGRVIVEHLGNGARPRGETLLPAPLVRGVTDLGTVRLVAPAPLAAGWVVDGRGVGVAEALVEVHTVERTEDGALERTRSARQLRPYRTTTAADGSFELRQYPEDLPSEAELALVASQPHHLTSEPLPFAVGAQDLVLFVARGGWIEGRLAVGEDAEVESFSVQVEVHDARDAAPDEQPYRKASAASLVLDARLDAPGPFTIGGLPDGSYELRFFGMDPFPALVVRNLHVRVGEVTTDPRLDPVVLTQRKLLLAIVDDAGEPIGAEVSLTFFRRPPGAERWPNVSGSDHEGDAFYLRTNAARLDIRVEAEGFQPLLVEGLSESTTLTLRRLGTVQVRVAPEAFDLLAADDAIRIALLEPATGTVVASTFLTRTEPEAELAVPAALDYPVTAGIRREVRQGSLVTYGLEAGGASPAVLDAADGSYPALLELTLDTDAVRAVLARFRR